MENDDDNSCVSDVYFDEDLAIDIPIGLAEAGASLPAPDEVRFKINSPKKGWTKRFWIVVMGVVCTTGIIVGVSVGVRNGNPSEEAGVSNGSANKTRADVPAEPTLELVPSQDKLEQVIAYLVNEGVSSRVDLKRSGSPQSLAAKWIATEDELNLSVPEDNSSTQTGYMYVSRYILRLLWHALEGPEWKDQLGDLSNNTHICEWNMVVNIGGLTYPRGLYCFRDNLLPGVLFLGK